MTKYEILSLWITGFGVAVACGVLTIYIFQLKAMKGQLKAAKDSADAAKQAADIAYQAMRLAHFASLEMHDWRGEVEFEETAEGGRAPRRINFWCDITNTGNIPARITQIETRVGAHVTTVAHNATVQPRAHYVYRHTVDAATAPGLALLNRVVGLVSGVVRYTHFFENRRRHFHQAFFFDNEIRIRVEPMEGAGNNDEADQEQGPN